MPLHLSLTYFCISLISVSNRNDSLPIKVSRPTHTSEQRVRTVVQVERSVEFNDIPLIKDEDAIVEGNRSQPMSDAESVGGEARGSEIAQVSRTYGLTA